MSEQKIYNPPGQSKIDYRIGNHPLFFKNMVQNLRTCSIKTQDNSKVRPLKAMRTRDKDDFAIALMDAGSMVFDILTFYQERIAQEAYIETATEPRSIIDLAASAGIELKHGKSAETYLSFTVNEAKDSINKAEIKAGSKIMGIPEKAEKMPPIFETAKAITALAELNSVKPAIFENAQTTLLKGAESIVIKGTDNLIKENDILLIISSDKDWETAEILSADLNSDEEYTKVFFINPLQNAYTNPEIYKLDHKVKMFGNNAADWSKLNADLRVYYIYGETDDQEKIDQLKNADQWPNYESSGDTLDLDLVYSNINSSKSHVLIKSADNKGLYTISEISEVYRCDFGIQYTVTRLKLDRNTKKLNPRNTEILIFESMLEIADTNIYLQDQNKMVLDGDYPSITASMAVEISGTTIQDTKVQETAFIKKVEKQGQNTSILFKEPLKNIYIQKTVTVNANTVHAIHGETVSGEILGSGDGTKANQKFVLKRSPIICTEEDDLEIKIRVNSVLWEKVYSLYGQPQDARVYMARTDEEGKCTVIFGDGINGARLPTGTENITVDYRVGEVPEGIIESKKLRFMTDMPAGILEVNNLSSSFGVKTPQDIETARRQIPIRTSTHDRIVSITDYEHFAASFSNFSKAKAAFITVADKKSVHITAAGISGELILKDSAESKKLYKAIRSRQASDLPVIIDSYIPIYIGIEADIFFDSRYLAEDIEQRVKSYLIERFCFEKQEFGESINKTDIIAVIQNIEGVIYIKIKQIFDSLTGADGKFPAAAAAIWNEEKGAVEPASQAIIDPVKSTIILNTKQA